jgi:hypothetical protein
VLGAHGAVGLIGMAYRHGLQRQPLFNKHGSDCNHDRNRRRRLLRWQRPKRPPRGHDQVHLELDQRGRDGGEPGLITFRISSLEDDVLPFNPPQFTERLPEWRAL